MDGWNLVGSDAIHRMAEVHVKVILKVQLIGSINTGVGRQLLQVSIVLLKADILSQAQFVQLLNYFAHVFYLFLDSSGVALVMGNHGTSGAGTRSFFELCSGSFRWKRCIAFRVLLLSGKSCFSLDWPLDTLRTSAELIRGARLLHCIMLLWN